MSKRYGRNQRRRAREQIAHLQEAYTRETGLLRWTSNKVRELDSQLADLAKLLGVNYIGLPAREIFMKARELDYNNSFRMRAPSGAVATMAVMEVERSNHDERSSMHVQVRLGPGAVRYAVSAQALMTTPSSFLARKMADEMAPFLLKEIRKLGYLND